ncbi:P-loop containing nucleoside triphosphate hydrolase protein [Entophlyctis helioformis]|nr:P-loop containing nucleoside triphosphate hydrolase protein [Entophlyctis helioformis]
MLTLHTQVYMPDGRMTSMTFDQVHDAHTAQSLFFDLSGIRDLVNQALNGYAATIFAFGQTGSGKTFTITGPDGPQTPDTVGIVPRALNFLFGHVATLRAAGVLVGIRIQASYLEIYNEHVQDLLNPPNTTLPVRWSAERGFYVENLFIVDCEVLDDALAVLEEGLRNRTTASHDMNEHSSRSHSVLTIYLETVSMDKDEGRPVKAHGKISFVDLAGSEKVKESKATGDTFTEALSINKSLLTLGLCITALSDSRKRQGHIPFRDSKLTKLLADSLGGNGLALMIACVSPGLANMAETIKTLRYASKARRIVNKPVVRLDAREEMVLILKREIAGLKKENQALRGALNGDRKYIATGGSGGMKGDTASVASVGTALFPPVQPQLHPQQHMQHHMQQMQQQQQQQQQQMYMAHDPLELHGIAGSHTVHDLQGHGRLQAASNTHAMHAGHMDGGFSDTTSMHSNAGHAGHNGGYPSHYGGTPMFPPITPQPVPPSSRHPMAGQASSRTGGQAGGRSSVASSATGKRQPSGRKSATGGRTAAGTGSMYEPGPPTMATHRVNTLKRSDTPAQHLPAVSVQPSGAHVAARATATSRARGRDKVALPSSPRKGLSAARSPGPSAASPGKLPAVSSAQRAAGAGGRLTTTSYTAKPSPARTARPLPPSASHAASPSRSTAAKPHSQSLSPSKQPKAPSAAPPASRQRQQQQTQQRSVSRQSTSTTTTSQGSPLKRPPRREHAPIVGSGSNGFTPTVSSHAAVSAANKTAKPRERLPLDQTLSVVNNRHLIMQDVHALNHEIGKMSAGRVR